MIILLLRPSYWMEKKITSKSILILPVADPDTKCFITILQLTGEIYSLGRKNILYRTFEK